MCCPVALHCQHSLTHATVHMADALTLCSQPALPRKTVQKQYASSHGVFNALFPCTMAVPVRVPGCAETQLLPIAAALPCLMQSPISQA